MGDAVVPGGFTDQSHDIVHDDHIPHDPLLDLPGAPGLELSAAPPELPAPPIPAAKLRAYTTAQLHLLGCLLHQPTLFHQTLFDNRTFDEAITPNEFLPGPERELYDVIYPLLSEGQQVTTSALLAHLASLSRQDLSNLATQVDADTEAATGLLTSKLQELFLTSANYILRLLAEPDSWRLRQALLTSLLLSRRTSPDENSPAITPANSPDLLGKRWTQERKTQVSKLRIFRPGK